MTDNATLPVASVTCRRCGHIYDVDRHMIRCGTWRRCPKCNKKTLRRRYEGID